MCRYTGKELNEVEQSLRKIKALADLLSFYERDSGGCISGESLQEIGYMMAGLAQKALAIFVDDEPPALATEDPAGGPAHQESQQAH